MNLYTLEKIQIPSSSVEISLSRRSMKKEIIIRVKSCNFRRPVKLGHAFANSGNPDETAPPFELSHHDFHCLLG